MASDQTATNLVTRAASGRAFGEGSPLRELTVNRTSVRVALAVFAEERAHVVAVCALGGNSTGASLETNAACLGALAPCAEGRNLAVNRAWPLVARLALLEGRARFAVHVCSPDNLAAARLLTLQAGLGAGTPLGELGDDAVDRAGKLIVAARKRLNQRRARRATLGRDPGDRAAAGPLARAT
jgi:hypothetical protein